MFTFIKNKIKKDKKIVLQTQTNTENDTNSNKPFVYWSSDKNKFVIANVPKHMKVYVSEYTSENTYYNTPCNTHCIMLKKSKNNDRDLSNIYDLYYKSDYVSKHFRYDEKQGVHVYSTEAYSDTDIYSDTEAYSDSTMYCTI